MMTCFCRTLTAGALAALICLLPCLLRGGESDSSDNVVPWPAKWRSHRAGHPDRVAWYARPSTNPRYIAGYVGGGAGRFGHPRLEDEGTWGMDYAGGLVKRRVWLRWSHGRREQDGGGSYRTDGASLGRRRH